MGQVHAKKVSVRPARACLNAAGRELAESVLDMGEDVVLLLGQVLGMFQGNEVGFAHHALRKLKVELSETLSKLGADLKSFPSGRGIDPNDVVLLRSFSRLIIFFVLKHGPLTTSPNKNTPSPHSSYSWSIHASSARQPFSSHEAK